MPGKTFAFILVLLFLVLILIIVVSLGVGAVFISPGTVIRIVADKILGVPLSGDDRGLATIIWDLRLARSLLAAVTGAALALSGAAFQGLFRNPLADPFVIGASSGAALGATIAIIFHVPLSFGGLAAVPAAAFLGAIGAVSLVYVISQTGTAEPPAVSLLLAGTALSSLFSAMVSFLMAMRDQELHRIFFWLLGGFNGKSWEHLLAVLPYMVVGFAVIGALARPLNAFGFGEENAQGLGLPVKRARLLTVLAAGMTTAAAVSVSGIIGFIGLVAPHMARMLFGPVHSRVLPASAILGAILLVLADDVARTVMAPVEIPVGVLTAMLGAPFFLYLLRRRQSSLGG